MESHLPPPRVCHRAGSCRRDSNLEQLRPQLSGDEETIAAGVVRDAIQHVHSRPVVRIQQP